MSESCAQRDLVNRRISWVVWGLPTVLLVLGGFMGPVARTLLWPPALVVMGVGCVVNAARCGRLHCYLTGPLYLSAAIAAGLLGLELVPLQWSWIVLCIVGGTVLAYIPEWVWGKYVVRPSASEG